MNYSWHTRDRIFVTQVDVDAFALLVGSDERHEDREGEMRPTEAEIEQARLLVLKTAWLIDQRGAREARNEISMIKYVVPPLQTRILDRAMQVFGAAGLTPDTPLSYLWTWGRALRFADGPDEVHWFVVGRAELAAMEEEGGVDYDPKAAYLARQDEVKDGVFSGP